MSGYVVSREFLVAVDSITSWVAHRAHLEGEWKESLLRVSGIARSIYEHGQEVGDDVEFAALRADRDRLADSTRDMESQLSRAEQHAARCEARAEAAEGALQEAVEFLRDVIFDMRHDAMCEGRWGGNTCFRCRIDAFLAKHQPALSGRAETPEGTDAEA